MTANHKEQIYQVMTFSACLFMERCKNLASLHFFLRACFIQGTKVPYPIFHSEFPSDYTVAGHTLTLVELGGEHQALCSLCMVVMVFS